MCIENRIWQQASKEKEKNSCHKITQNIFHAPETFWEGMKRKNRMNKACQQVCV
jgi:hypothetical protein